MNKDIEDLQNLWQSQHSKITDSRQFMDELNSIEKKNKRERIIMLSIFPITLLFLITLLPVVESWYYLFSIIIIGIAMLMILLLAYRIKYDTINDDKGFSNQQFIETHIQKLKNKMTLTSKYMWVYSALLILGINIGYIEAIKEMALFPRVGTHIFVTVLLIGVMYFGIKTRMNKYDTEIVPLIKKLDEMKNQLSTI